MRTTSILLTFFTILLATSCSDKSLEPIQPPDYEAKIVGDWLWLESCGGIAGVCNDSTAFGSEGISFTKDGISYGWCPVCDPLYSDYKIVQKISYYYGSDTIITAIEREYEDVNFVDLIIKQLDDSTLTLIQDCGDCYVTSYARIRINDPIIVDP